MVNGGEGPLELVGAYDEETNLTHATQILQSASADDTVERFVGALIFHPGHTHWHFEDFTEFELWTYADGGALDEMLATSGKMTFCLMDDAPLDPTPAGAPARTAFTGCGSQTQGISVGWSDTYGAHLIGQELDVAEVPDGRYALRTTVDPDGLLVETDDSNNDTVVYVELSGRRIELIAGG